MNFERSEEVVLVTVQGPSGPVNCGVLQRDGRWWVYPPAAGLHLTAGQMGAIAQRLVQENSMRGV